MPCVTLGIPKVRNVERNFEITQDSLASTIYTFPKLVRRPFGMKEKIDLLYKITLFLLKI